MFRKSQQSRQPQGFVEDLENRLLFAITTTTDCVKHPGPTDTEVTTARNPAGKQVPGQSSTTEESNRECRKR